MRDAVIAAISAAYKQHDYMSHGTFEISTAACNWIELS